MQDENLTASQGSSFVIHSSERYKPSFTLSFSAPSREHLLIKIRLLYSFNVRPNQEFRQISQPSEHKIFHPNQNSLSLRAQDGAVAFLIEFLFQITRLGHFFRKKWRQCSSLNKGLVSHTRMHQQQLLSVTRNFFSLTDIYLLVNVPERHWRCDCSNNCAAPACVRRISRSDFNFLRKITEEHELVWLAKTMLISSTAEHQYLCSLGTKKHLAFTFPNSQTQSSVLYPQAPNNDVKLICQSTISQLNQSNTGASNMVVASFLSTQHSVSLCKYWYWRVKQSNMNSAFRWQTRSDVALIIYRCLGAWKAIAVLRNEVMANWQERRLPLHSNVMTIISVTTTFLRAA